MMTAEILKLDTKRERIELRDGSAAERVGDALEVRDPRGRLLLRFCDGEAELVAAEGDLRLSAPRGGIVLESAEDVVLSAARDVVQRPQRAATIEAGGRTALSIDRRKLAVNTDAAEVSAKRSRLATGEASVAARRIVTHAERIATRVERYELSAGRLVERSRDAFREVAGLLQTKAARTRTLVSGVSSLFSERTVMVSERDTSIDGEKVLLG
jgi:hypothetical protein